MHTLAFTFFSMITNLNYPELFDLQKWRHISEERLYDVAKSVLIALGEKYRLTEVGTSTSPEALAYVHILHKPTNIEFALVPGGTFTLGLSEREFSHLNEIKKRSERFFEEWERVVDSQDEEKAGVLQSSFATEWYPKPSLIDEVLNMAPFMQPAHQINVPPFLMGIFTLSSENLMEFIPSMSDSSLRLYDESNGDALTYLLASEIRQLGHQFGDFVLPSEAMWEYAYRAGSPSLFPWGDKLPEFGPEIDPRRRFPAPSNPNLFGLEDMGNHKELCADAWRSSYNATMTKGGEQNAIEAGNTLNRQVIRGGAIDLWPWQGCGEWKMWLSAYRNSIFLDREDDRFNQASIRPVIVL